jgi:hypothetical protein
MASLALRHLAAPAAASVGLQLLLSPALADVAAAAVGVALPAYASAAAADAPDGREAAGERRRWLRYWAVLMAAAAAQRALVGGRGVPPGYSHARLLLVAWLASSQAKVRACVEGGGAVIGGAGDPR